MAGVSSKRIKEQVTQDHIGRSSLSVEYGCIVGTNVRLYFHVKFNLAIPAYIVVQW